MEKIEVGEIIEKFIREYKLKESVLIIYTDGSRRDAGKSTGVAIVMEDSDVAYYMSIDNRCSINTAELMAIKKALGMIKDMGLKKDVLILMDSQSACKEIESNDVSCNKHELAITIKKRIEEFEKKEEKGKV